MSTKPTSKTRGPHVSVARPMLAALAFAALLPAGAPFAQTQYFRCTDASGAVQFSDRACHGGTTGEKLVKPPDSAHSERKLQNDARMVRDKAWLESIEATRQAEEAAGRAAQQRQLEADLAVARRLDQERAARNSGTASVLPSTNCDLCRLPNSEPPAFGRWP